MPFIHQPETLGVKAGVDVRELFPKPAQRTHRLSEELMADFSALACKLERAAGSIFLAKMCWRSSKWLARSR